MSFIENLRARQDAEHFPALQGRRHSRRAPREGKSIRSVNHVWALFWMPAFAGMTTRLCARRKSSQAATGQFNGGAKAGRFALKKQRRNRPHEPCRA